MRDKVDEMAFSVSSDETVAIKQGMEGGQTLPLRWYSSTEVETVEKEKIFASAWHYVGNTADLVQTGQFITADIGEVPVIVVRDKDGSINAFHNVCRHRAAKVILEDKGKRRALQCHYHAWTYALDGSLKGAPRASSEECFVKQQLGLRKASAQTWGPFVFVHLSETAPDLMDWLGEVPALVAGSGLDIDNLRFNHRAEYDLACNWKVAMENYLECYHCPNAHPGFSDVMDTDLDAYQLKSEKGFAWQNGPLRPLAEGMTAISANAFTGHEGEVAEGRYFAVYPNLKININPGRGNLSIGPMIPSGPDSCHGLLDYYFGADVPEEWIGNMLEFDNQVGFEDRALVESVQDGIRSGSLTEGRIMLKSEALISSFQRWVLDQLSPEARL